MNPRWIAARCATLLVVLGLSACAEFHASRPPSSSYGEDKAALDLATRENSTTSHEAFLSRYPDSVWNETAVYRRDHAALEEAKRDGTPEAFRRFIDQYPNSAWIEQARYFLQYGYHRTGGERADQPSNPTPSAGPPVSGSSAEGSEPRNELRMPTPTGG